MKQNKPRIAVVTPVYNAGETIVGTIKSLKSQTFKNWIHIIVNDGSTDKTLEKITQETIMDSRFVIISYPENKGRGYAREIGLKKVLEREIEYMCMLDADDFYYPEKLQYQLNFMDKNLDITLMSTSIGVIDTQFNLNAIWGLKTRKMLFFNFSQYQNYIAVPHASSIIRVKDIGNITFDPNMKLSQDQDFMMRLLCCRKYAFSPTITYLYNRELSFSMKKYSESLDYHIYSLEKNGISKIKLRRIKYKNLIKKVFMNFVHFFGLYKFYLTQTSIKPSQNEMTYHNSWVKSIKL